MASDKPITANTTIAEAIRLCPSASEIFRRYGLGCAACMASESETIEDGALMHGLDVQALVDELNAGL